MEYSRWIVITLGTAFIYQTNDGKTVANCHKLPQKTFHRRMARTEEITQCLGHLIDIYPGRQWIFTVSPVRHAADGMHQNQLSKSTLLLAADQVAGSHDNVHYFPSYEILLDELRDYRFYAEDMAHPTEQAADYIFEKFIGWGLEPAQQPLFEKACKVRQLMQHRLLNPDTPQGRQFAAHRDAALEQLMKELSHEYVRTI